MPMLPPDPAFTDKARTLRVQTREPYDAIVIGSGISGGWSAKELAEAGLKTLLLERGRHVEHGDYPTEHRPPWKAPFRGRGDRLQAQVRQHRQSKVGPYGEDTAHWYVDDIDQPYETGEEGTENEFLWIRGDHLGGRSVMWGRQSYRLSPMDFEANARDGLGTPWPVSYAEIEPWYAHVERFVGISGEARGLRQLPDSEFLPPMDFLPLERHLQAAVEGKWPYRAVTMGRVAMLTQRHLGRGPCHYCGPCARGCSAGAYFCSLSSTLPAAQATGNLTLKTDAVVHSLIYDEAKDRVTGVRVVDRVTKETTEYFGRVVFLNASTFGSTQILLNTKTPRFPDGLGNQSGLLGRGVMDHQVGPIAVGNIPGYDHLTSIGNRSNGPYVPRYQNLPWAPESRRDFARGFGFTGGSWRAGWTRGAREAGIGVDLKAKLRRPGPWTTALQSFGEMLAYDSNRFELTDKLDQWGLPIPRITAALGDNERRMREAMTTDAVELLETSGAENVRVVGGDYRVGEGIHEMGTARMSATPETGCVDKHNRVHEIPNLYVTDGSFMTSGGCQNPSLTYMAFAARAANHAVEAMKRGELRV